MRLSTNTFSISTAMLALSLTFLIPSSAALGQAGSADHSNPSYSGAPGNVNPNTIDDTTLKHTAKAYVKVRQIMQTAKQAFNDTNDEAQKQQIAKQAESKKVAAVKSEGLQPQQYNQVLQLAQVDKSFQQKFLSYVTQVKNSPSEAD